MDSKPKIIVILGPTASGKTSLAIKIAKKVNGEIISADSRQVYKGLDIGTGKVTKKEMSNIPHHLLDIANPKKTFTVADWQKMTKKKIEEIITRGKTPIICGGTGFYIQSIVENLVLPEVPPNLKLRKELSTKTTIQLFDILKKLDPTRAKHIDNQNPVRLIRAIEIVKAIGKVPKLKTSGKSSYDFIQIGIKITPEELTKNIHQRLLSRLKQGMIDEVKNLHKKGLTWKRMEELGLEYRYLARFLQNKITKAEIVEQLEKEIIRYAKRQMTWFKRDKKIKWIKSEKEIEKILK